MGFGPERCDMIRPAREWRVGTREDAPRKKLDFTDSRFGGRT